MALKWEVRREVWKITEMRDGCIYRTESKGLIWTNLDDIPQDFEECKAWEKKIAQEHGGDFLGSVSTSLPYEETTRVTRV